MTLVVSDTSPVRALAHVGQLEFLKTLYGEVWVPPSVVAELASPRGRGPAVDAIAAGLIVRAPADVARVATLKRDLDPGESEAIALALEVGADLLLIDEYDGRAIAKGLGLSVKGVLGLLVDAKAAGLLVSVGPVIDRLQAEIDSHVAPHIRRQILAQAGEADQSP
jgi:uncharacterized protein